MPPIAEKGSSREAILLSNNAILEQCAVLPQFTKQAKMKTRIYYLLIVIVTLSGCGHSEWRENPSHEVATILQPGQSIALKGENGSVSIIHAGPFKREFITDEGSYIVQYRQRTEEFRNQRGIYSPASRATENIHGGIARRFVVEESVVNLTSEQEVSAYLRGGATYIKWVPGSDGLIAGFAKTPSRDQINFSLYRILINGKPVTSFPKQYIYPGNLSLTNL